MTAPENPQVSGGVPSGVDSLRAVGQALGLTLSNEQVRLLLDYLALLQRWNGTYNLTAVRDPAAMFTQHLADCLAVIGPLERHLRANPAARRLLDVGSGGGLPGVVIAVLATGLEVSCVDTVGKKVAFVRQVAGNLRLPNLHALHGRVEAVRTPPFDVITSRAFASLPGMCRLTRGHLAAGGIWLAMKGKLPDDEIAALPSDIDVFHVEPLQVPGLDAQRCLVWMRLRQVG